MSCACHVLEALSSELVRFCLMPKLESVSAQCHVLICIHLIETTKTPQAFCGTARQLHARFKHPLTGTCQHFRTAAIVCLSAETAVESPNPSRPPSVPPSLPPALPSLPPSLPPTPGAGTQSLPCPLLPAPSPLPPVLLNLVPPLVFAFGIFWSCVSIGIFWCLSLVMLCFVLERVLFGL